MLINKAGGGKECGLQRSQRYSPASPLHLSVSLAQNGLRATNTHTHTLTHILTRSERECVIEGEEREVRRLFVAPLLTGCWVGREPPKVVEKKLVCACMPACASE